MIEPIVFYGLIFGVSIVAVVLTIITFYYKKLLGKFYDIWRDQEKMKSAYTQVDQLVADAQRQREEIIKKANMEAHQIIERSNIFADQQRAFLTNSLETVSQKEQNEYKNVLITIKTDTMTLAQKLMTDLQQETVADIAKLQKSLSDNLIKNQQTVTQQFMQEYQNMKTSLDSYKAERITKIDRAIVDIIRDVTINAINQQIPMEAHAEYVLKILKEAKERNEL